MKPITYSYTFLNNSVMILVAQMDPQLTTSNLKRKNLGILPQN